MALGGSHQVQKGRFCDFGNPVFRKMQDGDVSTLPRKQHSDGEPDPAIAAR